MQLTTQPQQIASVEPQFERNMQESLQQNAQFLQQNANTVHIVQNPVCITTMQQQHNHGYRQPMIVSNQNSQMSQSMTIANQNTSRIGISHIGHHSQGYHSQGHHSQGHHSSNQVIVQQCHGQNTITVPANMIVTDDGQIVPCSSNKQTLEKSYISQQCSAEQFQKQNFNQISLIPRTTNLTNQVQTRHVQNQISVTESKPIVFSDKTENVLLSNSSAQQENNHSVTESTVITMTARCQPIYSSPQSQPAVAMTTATSNPHKVEEASLPVEPTHYVQQPKTDNDLTESDGMLCQAELKEELPDIQQIHGECVMCGKYSLYLCSSCKKLWYCSPTCQVSLRKSGMKPRMSGESKKIWYEPRMSASLTYEC